LAAHNPEINWKTGEVKMKRCPFLCGRVKMKEDVRKANSKPELSQLLFISIRQRELVRVLIVLG